MGQVKNKLERHNPGSKQPAAEHAANFYNCRLLNNIHCNLLPFIVNLVSDVTYLSQFI